MLLRKKNIIKICRIIVNLYLIFKNQEIKLQKEKKKKILTRIKKYCNFIQYKKKF